MRSRTSAVELRSRRDGYDLAGRSPAPPDLARPSRGDLASEDERVERGARSLRLPRPGGGAQLGSGSADVGPERLGDGCPPRLGDPGSSAQWPGFEGGDYDPEQSGDDRCRL